MKEQKNWEEELKLMFDRFDKENPKIIEVKEEFKQFISKVVEEVREEEQRVAENRYGAQAEAFIKGMRDTSGFAERQCMREKAEARADERKKVIEELLEELPKIRKTHKPPARYDEIWDRGYKCHKNATIYLLTNKLNK